MMILMMSIPEAQTLERPPFRRDGARSPSARMESKLNVLAMSLCQSSESGHPMAASIASLPCLVSASLIQKRVFFDLEKPRGSNPTSPARLPSSAMGAFVFPNGNHFAGRATFLAGGGENEIGAVSSEENNADDLTLERADEGANAVADATRVEIRIACIIFVFVVSC
jgi:hypothetical protein